MDAATVTAGGDLPLFAIITGLFGGLALFLFGLEQLTGALKAAAGDNMRGILAAMTRNRLLGVITGAVTTAVIQSSSVTTVLVVGFISAGVMTLTQAIGVIMGANIGSTVFAQVIAFRITDAALPLIAIGFVGASLQRGKVFGQWGGVLLGLGLVFLGMMLMGNAMEPLRDWPPFLDAIASMKNPVLGILAGALFTALVQSSGATTGIVIVMAGQGIMSIEAGIPIILGANIGTCVTALLAAIGRPREAVRASLAHVLFNVISVFGWVWLIGPVADLMQSLTPGDVARQIANAHTLVNVGATVVLIWFAPLLTAVITRLIPERPKSPEEEAVTPRYLDPALLSTPPAAMEAVRRELGRIGWRARRMVAEALPAALHGSKTALDRLARMDDSVDALYEATIDYLRRLGAGTLTPKQTAVYMRLMEVARGLESIGDLVETDIVSIGRRRLEEKVTVSEHTARRVGDLHARVLEALDLTLKAVAEDDREAARRVVAMKPEIQAMVRKALDYGATRLLASEPNRVNAYARETEVVEQLRRVYYFSKRICRAIAEPEPAPPAVVEASRAAEPSPAE
ncbi:Sodium-dependent phosphate transporter [Caenispirillum salinarum AK4]|uniref:Sodium-dependent phosphate transporter n=1 Tax=Caenispirillum salinarum AK4 TaxID=1238182 RepID=K9GRF9_9PROT|nr:Na/Pi cotransporter family protein [Caenispirillum salinarum]EKV27324.1 Sodium-dependent phosphate transporter [Caenispirillum salinarum AK4]